MSSRFLAPLRQSTYGNVQRWEPKREKERKSLQQKGGSLEGSHRESGEGRAAPASSLGITARVGDSENLLPSRRCSWEGVDVRWLRESCAWRWKQSSKGILSTDFVQFGHTACDCGPKVLLAPKGLG